MLSQVLLSVVGLDRHRDGRPARPETVAAVGYATQFFPLAQSVLFAIGFACVALMARAIGAGDPARARRALAASLLVVGRHRGAAHGDRARGAALVLAALGAEPAVIAPRSLPAARGGSTLLLAVAITLESALRADRDTRRRCGSPWS